MDPIIGTAGWSIPRDAASAFPADGTALERYARVFGGVEVNSSFYRSHRPSTWARWAASVPDGFRFAVKLPRTITHQARLVDVEPLVTAFVHEVEHLGRALSVILIQLPPTLAFEPDTAGAFFATMRQATRAALVCEPRHPSWFDPAADTLLRGWRVSRAAADPAITPAAAVPGGCPAVAYWRLHGSPTMYRSPYDAAAIDGYARQVAAAVARGAACWCMFDNTIGPATRDALALRARFIAGTRRIDDG